MRKSEPLQTVDPIETELESLEAIYINELTYKRKSDGTLDVIELLLHPATGDDVAKQFVCMTVVFIPTPKYPDEIPIIEIKNPRGLGEEEVASLVEDMISKANECVGEVMLFTLIEMAKDSLTEGNIPHCPCVVCLEHFHENDAFHRTSCYHYFHNSCLHRYLEHSRRQIEEEEEREGALERRHLQVSEEDKVKTICCPLCRAPLDEASLSVTYDPVELEHQQDADGPPFTLPPGLKEQQVKMAELFAKQKAKGGIIDLEEEKNKYLVNAEDRLPLPTLGQTSLAPKLPESAARPQSESKPQHKPPNHGTHFRNGRTEPREGAGGRGRGHHQMRERDGMNHGHYRGEGKDHRLRHHHPHHHQQQYSSHGRGKSGRGGSAHRGGRVTGERSFSNSGNEAKASESVEVYEQDNSLHTEARSKNAHGGERRRQQECNVAESSKEIISSRQSSENLEEGPIRRPGTDSRHEEFGNRYSKDNRRKHGERNENRGRGYNDRPRGRGRDSADTRRLGYERNGFKEEMKKDGDEVRADCSTADRGVSPENEKVEMKEHRKEGGRAYQRGKGRGRFRDFDKSYFEGKGDDCLSNQVDKNCDKAADCKKNPAAREESAGCREKPQHDHRRNTEYDDDDGTSSYRGHRRPAGSGREQRGQGGREAGRQDRKDGDRKSSYSKGYSAKHQMLENSHEDDRQISGNKTTGSRGIIVGSTNEDSEEKIKAELEMNRRWRKINFGYNVSEAAHANYQDGQVIDGEKDNDHQTTGNVSGNIGLENVKQQCNDSGNPCRDSSDLSTYYVGYDEVEEEEDWDEERFAYAYERRHVKTEKLEHYDKFRKKDYDLRTKKVEERDKKERLLLEEERRMRREQAEAERKAANSAEAKPAKSVLELFQEKQAAKKREAELLKAQQSQEKETGKKVVGEKMSDNGFESGSPTSSSASSFESGSASSFSSQGYQSQSSTKEELHQQELLELQNDTEIHTLTSEAANPEAPAGLANTKSAFGQISSEILWVGVKKRPDPDDFPCPSNREFSRAAKQEHSDPYQDALEQREERRRAKNKRKKKGKRAEKEFTENDVGSLELTPETQGHEASSAISDTPPEKLDSANNNTKCLSLVVQNSDHDQSKTSEPIKQKPLTKAPPLKLQTRHKLTSASRSANVSFVGTTALNSSDLTKDEVAQLKALYQTDTEAQFLPQMKAVNQGSLKQEFENENEIPYNKDVGLSQVPHADELSAHIPQCDIEPQTCPIPVEPVENENRKALTAKVIPQSLVKQMRKAPPLKLKQVSSKLTSCETREPASSDQNRTDLKRTGGKDISKVMKYLGIEVDDESLLVEGHESTS